MIVELQNPSIGISELHKIHQSLDHEAQMLWKGRSGILSAELPHTYDKYSNGEFIGYWMFESMQILVCSVYVWSILQHFEYSDPNFHNFKAAKWSTNISDLIENC